MTSHPHVLRLLCLGYDQFLDDRTRLSISGVSHWFRGQIWCDRYDALWRQNHDRVLCIAWIYALSELDTEDTIDLLLIRDKHRKLISGWLHWHVVHQVRNHDRDIPAWNLKAQHSFLESVRQEKIRRQERNAALYRRELDKTRADTKSYPTQIDLFHALFQLMEQRPDLDHDDLYHFGDEDNSCTCFNCKDIDLEPVRDAIEKIKDDLAQKGFRWTIDADYRVFIWDAEEPCAELDEYDELALQFTKDITVN